MFQFSGFPPYGYLIHHTVHSSPLCGFPHSDIPGSMLIYNSPRLFAVHRVLRRLLMPRHSSYALLRLNVPLDPQVSPRIRFSLSCLSFDNSFRLLSLFRKSSSVFSTCLVKLQLYLNFSERPSLLCSALVRRPPFRNSSFAPALRCTSLTYTKYAFVAAPRPEPKSFLASPAFSSSGFAFLSVLCISVNDRKQCSFLLNYLFVSSIRFSMNTFHWGVLLVKTPEAGRCASPCGSASSGRCFQ